MNTKRQADFWLAKKLVTILSVMAICFVALNYGAQAFTAPHTTNQDSDANYYDSVDRYNEMSGRDQNGSAPFAISEEINQEQKSIDILCLPHVEAPSFESCIVGDIASKITEEVAPTPLQKKIDRMKSEYEVAGQVYEYLNNQGMSDTVIAGILGNMMAECGGQTLDLDWDVYGFDGSSYYGLCQWSLSFNPDVDGQDIVGQLDYLMSNIQINMDYFGGDYDEFCAITNVETAAKYFCNYYERGAGVSTRVSNAVTALEWIQKNSDAL